MEHLWAEHPPYGLFDACGLKPMKFAVPRIWRESNDCYFCIVNVHRRWAGKNKKKTSENGFLAVWWANDGQQRFQAIKNFFISAELFVWRSEYNWDGCTKLAALYRWRIR
ncbi:hypothetical protein EVAR_13529_1 [Eumeta japonica]|uniref:Uncharacterized protein n=1 Tax=Eumeta variegata TaxID=151549 RepID=A0A4C1U8U8_EUMVA|nr:hypothetical protein EVAR_13529_1 [Eumeta japonica]